MRGNLVFDLLLTKVAVETISNIQTVATLGQEDRFYQKYFEVVAEFYQYANIMLFL